MNDTIHPQTHYFQSSEGLNPEKLKKSELGARLKEYFSSIDSKYALLLVFNAQQTLTILRDLGVDVSTYSEGIYELLYGDNITVKKHEYEERKPFEEKTSHSERNRSLSPSWRTSLPPRASSPVENKNHVQEPDSTTEVSARFFDNEHGDGDEDEGEGEDEDEDDVPPSLAKVFVVDIRSMFLTMSTLDGRSLKDLRDVGRRLGIPYDETGSPSNACS